MFEDVGVLAGRLAAAAPPGPDGWDESWADRSVLDPDGALVQELVGVEKAKAAAEARLMVIMAELCRRAQRWQPAKGWSSEGLSAEELAGAEIGPALRLAPVTAALRVHRAAQVTARLPGTLAALGRGELDVGRVLAIYDATMPLIDELAARVEQVVLPGACDQTAGELRAALRRAVIVADPAAAEKRRKAAVRDRAVHRYTRPDGMSAIEAVLSAIDSGEIYDLIDEVARQSKTAGDTRSMDARRADAYVQLLLGRDPYLGPEDPLPPPPAGPPPDPDDEPTPPWQQPPDDWTAAGCSDSPHAEDDRDDRGGERADQADAEHADAEQPDLGSDGEPGGGGTGLQWAPMPVEPADLDQRHPPTVDQRERLSELAIRCLAAVATRRPPKLPWVHIHQVTGADGRAVLVAELEGIGPVTVQVANALLAAGAARPPPATAASDKPSAAQTRVHDPPRRLAEQVRARDGSCRFPGCRRSARRCDLDHTLRFPDGPTTADNLAALCRRHHRLKHAGGWTVQQTSGAVLVWTSRTGRSYQTYPRAFDGTWRGASRVDHAVVGAPDPDRGMAHDSRAA